MRPETGLFQIQGKSPGLNTAGERAQLIQPCQPGLAEEHQGQMDGLGPRALAAAQLLQFLADMVELGPGFGVGPQRKEQPGAFRFGLFDDFTPKISF